MKDKRESFFPVVFYSFYVLEGNYIELNKTVEKYLETTVGDDFLLSVERQINLSISAGREIGRRIHNYSAAWYSLVEHSYRIRKKIDKSNLEKDQAFAKEYAAKISEYLGDSFENKFIKDLRRYVQHKNILVPSLQFRVERIWDAPPQEEGVLCNMSHSFEINSSEIKDFDWSVVSREYIDSRLSVPVSEIIQNHFSLMRDFCQWIEYRDLQLRPFVPKEIKEATF
jgi:hypothetical protein